MSLIKEIRLDNTEKVLELLETPQDVNQIDIKSGSSCLHLAIKNMNPTILKALLKASSASPININIQNKKDGSTPLLYALQMNFFEGIELLLQAKAEINLQFPDGKQLLHFAAAQNTPQILELLIENKVPLNVLAKCGTPLHCALSANQIDNALFLIDQKNIQLEGIDQDGENVIHICAAEGLGDVLNSLIEKAKSNQKIAAQVQKMVNAQNNEGNTPLHLAAIEDRQLMIEILINNEDLLALDKNIKNKAGLSYQQIITEARKKKQQEEEQIIQRKKIAQEEKNIKNQQRRQQIIEQNKQEEEEKKNKKFQKEKAQASLKTMESRTRIIFIGALVLVMVAFYLTFQIAAQKKKSDILI